MTLSALTIAVLGAWFGQANPIVHIPGVVLLFPAVLTWHGLNAESPRHAFKWGWICGSLSFTACLYWVFIPVHVYGGVPWFLALLCPALLGMYLGLYSGIYATLVHRLKHRLPAPLLAAAAGLAWGALEMAQGTLFTGFPWLTLAVAAAPWPAAIQSLAFVGEYWLSALFAGFTAGLVLGRKSRFCLLGAAALGLILLVFGAAALNAPLPDAPRVRIALIQGNIDQGRKWDETYQRATVERYLQLTRKELVPRPDLVIWPETAMPFYLQEENALSRQVRNFVRESGLPLLTGAPRYSVDPSSGAIEYTNSAFLLDQSGKTVAVYDKEHLVPFGEYVPLAGLLPFISRLAHGEGDFVPGKDPAPLRLGNLALGMLICYEAIFTHLSQVRVREGANLLVNISNDAWFGHSSAPRQHLHQAVLRAVEQGRFLVRSTNTGITAVVDPRGRRLETGTLFQKLTLSCPDVQLLEGLTFFHRYYKMLQIALPAAAIAMLLAARLFRPRENR